MSMLAEPRKKQRWTLNPRGKQWSDDQNKFGQKMLEKMGWTAGKGLGVNEQGMTEHVRVKHKDDHAGIGYSKDSQDKLWTQHQEGFNELLQKLKNGEESTSAEKSMEKCDLSGKSLELKSKHSRARLHYHKFTRGKDVNKYSTKDLANIFGKKDLNNKYKEESKAGIHENEEDPQPVGSTDKTSGILTIKGGVMSDYFKNKIPLISSKTKRSQECKESTKFQGNKNEAVLNKGKVEISLEKDLESESERCVGFGYHNSHEVSGKSLEQSKKSYPSLLSFKNPVLDLDSPKSTPKKRKSELYCSTPAMEEKKYQDMEFEATPKKRKIESYVFENPGLDLQCSDPSMPSTSSNSSYSTPIRCKMEVLRCESTPIECISQDELDKKEERSESIKKKKKSKRKNIFVGGITNEALNIDDRQENSPTINADGTSDIEMSYSADYPSSILRNRMEVLRSEVSIECIPEDGHKNQNEELESTKKKKKKKRRDPFVDGFVNDALNIDDKNEDSLRNGTSNVSENFEVSRSDVFGLANDALDLTDEVNGKKRVTFSDVVEYNTDSVKKKKKLSGKLDKFEVDIEKSKKKKKFLALKGTSAEVSSFENKALDVEVIDEEIIDNEENERKMNQEKRSGRGRRMSNLETIEEVVEEEELEEINSGMPGFDDTLVRNASDNFEEMYLQTPIKKKIKKHKVKKQVMETDDMDEPGCNDVDDPKGKKQKLKKTRELNDTLNDFTINIDMESKMKTRKSKVKNKGYCQDMEIDEDFVEVCEQNSNKENENSQDAKDSLKVGKKERRAKKNKENEDRQDEEVEADVEDEERKFPRNEEVCEVGKQVLDTEKGSMNNEDNSHVTRDENITKSPKQSKSKRPKKIFKALFAKTPMVHFAGSNINDIKGYGIP